MVDELLFKTMKKIVISERLRSAEKFECLDNSLLSIDEINDLELNKKYTRLDISNARKLVNNYFNRLYRIKKCVSSLLEEECCFVTFTISDEYINNSLPYLRRKLVEVLNNFGCSYIGNVDYGSSNDRLHFHILIQCFNFDESLWRYGFVGVRKVYNKSKNISRYISKLSNHTIKTTTKNIRIIKKIF